MGKNKCSWSIWFTFINCFKQWSSVFQVLSKYYFGTCTYILKRHNKGPIKEKKFPQKEPLFANLIKKTLVNIEVPTYTYEPAVQLYGVDGIQQSTCILY